MPDDDNVVHVPKAEPGSFNAKRPLTANSLLYNQVQHFRELEKNLQKQLKAAPRFKAVKTEGDAAAYIRRITELLHPRLAKKRTE